MLFYIISFVVFSVLLLSLLEFNSMLKQKKRVEDCEYTQRFITHNRNGYNDGIK